MPSFCVVSNCEYKYASAANISFHKFPLNSPELLKKWIEFTDRGPDWFPSKWSSICSRHFLPSDFRIQHLRKCLKRTAAPSVTMKSLDFSSIPANDFSENHYKVKRIVCRLCAKGGTEDQSKSILELGSTLVKCLPTIRLSILEHLPNEVCGDCIKKLIQYSLFIDRVASVQKDFFGINADETDGQSTTKPMIIKQEPIANIKQEIFEFNKSTRNVDDFFPQSSSAQDYYTDGESDAYCEFCDFFFINNVELKNHIVDCHSDNQCNPRERANNCEIMEIITLENAAFIDLDENCVEENTAPQLQRVMKVEETPDVDRQDVLIQTISAEHSYASMLTTISEGHTSIVRNLKQEEMNVQVKSFIQPKQVEPPSVNEIEPEDGMSMEPIHYETVETEPLKETSCDKLESETLLNGQTVHVPKTKICPICTAHCRTIYHYFMHRSKYHNWSKKTRRPKRRLYFKCSDCSKMFLSKFAFDNHNRYSCSSLRFKCSICHLEFSSGMSMLIHKRICKVLMARSFEQSDNNTKGNRRMKLDSYRKLVNSIGRQGQIVSQQAPGRPTKSVHHHRHRTRDKNDIRITHVVVSSANATESFRPNKRGGKRRDIDPLQPYTKHGCTKDCMSACDKQLKVTKNNNTQHGLTRIADSPQLYACNICNKQFRIKSYLYQHLVTHDNERKHKCNMCTKEFKRLAGLNQHIRGYHYKIKPHECTVCKHRFALKGDMRRCRHSTLQNKT
ncbi:zinc finger protein 184-like [Bradysia coprophila]|uniref:zinc finger protein 184-like n=1 Tax=Bradysia coprophila TaxID=38358 RepID=UPI00187DD823|nr:zinc finger protein 184-like [Bradysia coprophila]